MNPQRVLLKTIMMTQTDLQMKITSQITNKTSVDINMGSKGLT